METKQATRGRHETPTARLVLSADAPREEWLAARRQGITATDVAAITGNSKYKTAYDVWTDKVLPAADNDAGEAAFWGTLLEDPIAQAWAKKHGVRVRRVGLVANINTPWALASLDRLVHGCPDGRCALEVKTRSLHVANEWEQGVPSDVVDQVQWQLYVTGLDHAHVAALIGGQRLVEHVIKFDAEAVFELHKAAELIWQAVQSETPPQLPEQFWSMDYLDKRHPVREGEIELGDAVRAIVDDYELINSRLHELEDRKRELRTRLVGALGEAEIALIDGRQVYSYKATHRTTIDSKKLKAAYPAVADDPKIYTTNTTRTLRVNITKNGASE